MTNRNKNIRKLTSTGRKGSFTVVIPATDVQALGWREHQRLIVKRIPRVIVIRDAMTRRRKKNAK